MSGNNKIVFGQLSETVVSNMSLLKEVTGLSWADLSRRTAIPAISLRRMAEKKRRVNVDDVGLLARAFGLELCELLEPIEGAEVSTLVTIKGGAA